MAAIDEVLAAAHFPESNPFGLVVNGENNNMVLSLANTGENNYTLVSASASYHDPAKDWKLVKNTTAVKFNIPLTAGGNLTAPFRVNSEFRPQELGLTVWVDVKNGNEISRVTAFNQTVSIVEPPSSWFDPSVLFIYLVLGAALFGGAYAAFNMYFAAPQKKGRRSAAKAAAPVEAADVADSGKAYQEDWIPVQHLGKKKGGRRTDGASSAGEGFTSGGEGATSGGEVSGAEGKTRRRKSKK